MERDTVHQQFDSVVKQTLNKHRYVLADTTPSPVTKDLVHEEFDTIIKNSLNKHGYILEENTIRGIEKPLNQRTDEYILLDLEYLNEE